MDRAGDLLALGLTILRELVGWLPMLVGLEGWSICMADDLLCLLFTEFELHRPLAVCCAIR